MTGLEKETGNEKKKKKKKKKELYFLYSGDILRFGEGEKKSWLHFEMEKNFKKKKKKKGIP